MIGLEFPKNTSSLLSICSFFHRFPCLSYLTPVPRWKHQISHSAHRRLPGVRVNLSIVFLVSCCWAVSCLRNTSSLSLTGYLISCLSAPGTAHIGMRLGSPRAGPSGRLSWWVGAVPSLCRWLRGELRYVPPSALP